MSTVAGENSGPSISLTVKAAAGVFVTVVAPVLVAAGMKLVDVLTTSAKPPDPAAAATPAAAPVVALHVIAAPPVVVAPPAAVSQRIAIAPSVAPVASAAVPPDPVAATPAPMSPVASPVDSVATGNAASGSSEPAAPVALPDDWSKLPRLGSAIRLFNGRDLAGFYSYLGSGAGGGKPAGRNQDNSHVFSVRNGALVVSGETPGVLVSKREFSDYYLKLQYRWGEKTWPPKEDRARSSGVLLHCHGRDGAVKRAYPLSVRCDLVEGSSGDLAPYGGADNEVNISVQARRHEFVNADKYKQLYCYEPGQPVVTLATGYIKRNPVDLDWRDTLGYNSAQDIERPHGQWNDLECVCLGNRVTVRLNGRVVNDVVTNLSVGKIAFQSHYAAILFRDVVLQPLKSR